MTVKEELDRIRAETPEDDDAAEPAAPDAPEAPDDDNAPEPPPPPAAPDVDPDALEKESKRHERALAKIIGPGFADSLPCEECGATGYLPPWHEPAPQLQPHPTLVTCRTCDGYGVLATPSKNPQYATEPCNNCRGSGHVDKATYETMVAPPAPQPFAGAPMPPPPPRWDQARGAYVDEFGNMLGSPSMYAAPGVNGPANP